jgi:hypothetical protein
MRFINPITDEALRYDSGEGLTSDEDSYLPRVPMPDGSVEDGDEGAKTGLYPGVTEIEQVKSPKASTFIFRQRGTS